MGRAKIKVKLIEREITRVLTFKKRSEGLIKKMQQLTTLCDVKGCIIINGGDHHGQNSTWPENDSDEVRRLFELYKSKSREIGGVKSYGLSDFFLDKQREIEEEVSKLRKKNGEGILEGMNESELRGLSDALQTKAEIIRSRIEFLKQEQMQELEIIKNKTMMIHDLEKNMVIIHPMIHSSFKNQEPMHESEMMVHNFKNQDMMTTTMINPSYGVDFMQINPISYDISHLPRIDHNQNYGSQPPMFPFWPESSSAPSPPPNLNWSDDRLQLPMMDKQHQYYSQAMLPQPPPQNPHMFWPENSSPAPNMFWG